MKNRIVVDMDEVLVELVREWLKYANELSCMDIRFSEVYTWALPDMYGKYKQQVLNILSKPCLYEGLLSIEGAIAGFRELDALAKRTNYELIVCSAVPPFARTAASEKHTWLNERLPKKHPRTKEELDYKVVFTESKELLAQVWYEYEDFDYQTTVSYCNDILIDDALHNIAKWPGHGILLNKPWNQIDDMENFVDKSSKFTRVRNWQEIIKAVKKIMRGGV